MKTRTYLWGAALLIAFAALAFADGRGQHVAQVAVAPGFKVSEVSAAYRTALDGGESLTDLEAAAGIGAITSIQTAGFQNLAVTGHLSTGSATCVIDVICFYDGIAKHRQTATLTAGATYTNDDSEYLSATQTFTTHGCGLMKVLAADPSAGTVDLWVEVY